MAATNNSLIRLFRELIVMSESPTEVFLANRFVCRAERGDTIWTAYEWREVKLLLTAVIRLTNSSDDAFLADELRSTLELRAVV